jgi:hypothetical protein
VLHQTRTSDVVFSGARRGKPISNMAMLMLLRRMGRGELTAHGFRSTFRDWAAECTNFPREIAEMRWRMSSPTRSKPLTGAATSCQTPAAHGGVGTALSRQLFRARIETQDSLRVMPLRQHLATVRSLRPGRSAVWIGR